MCKRQRTYTDVDLEFRPFLCPLTDGWKATTRCLAKCMLLVWHWASIQFPPTYPPAPTCMDIGRWMGEELPYSIDQWVAASAHAYQRVAEAAIGHEWTTTVDGPVLPTVTKLVETMLNAVGYRVLARSIRE